MQIKIQKKQGRRLSFATAVVLMLVSTLVFTACSSGTGNAGTSEADPSGSPEIKEGESLVIPASDISETAEYYPLTVDGTRMEVVAVKAPDGTIRTAFNTCQVCNGSPKAYFEQSGTALKCQNCGNKFPMSRVGIEAGGCNPVPIIDEDKTVTDEAITVPYSVLQENAYRFPSNWKQ